MLEPYKMGDYQFFRQWLAEAWNATGGRIKDDIYLPMKLKIVIGKLGLARVLPWGSSRRRKLLVTCVNRVEYFSWPWCYSYEIVPIVWDCWPKHWRYLPRFCRANRVKTVFCTSSQTAEYVRKECPGVNAVWLPEGIKVSLYPMGPSLRDRPVDVLEMGRQMPSVHSALTSLSRRTGVKHLYQAGDRLLFPDFDALTKGLRDAKITICHPRCDTNPEMAGDVETMTQRYWECMLSGTLIVGRAPRELVEFCGYDPVVTLGDDIEKQLLQILDGIGEYQELVRKNRQFAEEHADWKNRIAIIRNCLKA